MVEYDRRILVLFAANPLLQPHPRHCRKQHNRDGHRQQVPDAAKKPFPLPAQPHSLTKTAPGNSHCTVRCHSRHLRLDRRIRTVRWLPWSPPWLEVWKMGRRKDWKGQCCKRDKGCPLNACGRTQDETLREQPQDSVLTDGVRSLSAPEMVSQYAKGCASTAA